MKSEDYHGGETEFHGAGGEWKVARQRLTLGRAARRAGGRSRTRNHAARRTSITGDNEGTGFFDVNQRNGWRWNTAKGFLAPARSAPTCAS